MEKMEVGRQMLASWLATPVVMAAGDGLDFEEFQRRHCLDPHFQPFFTAAQLRRFCGNMEEGRVYVVRDPLDMMLVLLILGERRVLVGPYTQKHWDRQEGEGILSRRGIPASALTAYQLYRCQYTVVDNDTVFRGIVSLMELSGRIGGDYFFEEIRLDPPEGNRPIRVPEKYTVDHVNRNYALETAFHEAVRKGDAEKALGINRMLAKEGEISYSARNDWNAMVGISIMRTKIRLAAKDSGLPMIAVDAISRDYAQRLNSIGRTGSIARFSDLTEDMIREICKEIRKMHMARYSPLVLKAISYIRLNLSHDLSVSRIAREVEVSPGYLSKQFKRETGETVSGYVRTARSRKAAQLMISTRHAVQDISNYVGYTDNNYFVKIFRRAYGMTPSEYRKKYRL